MLGRFWMVVVPCWRYAISPRIEGVAGPLERWLVIWLHLHDHTTHKQVKSLHPRSGLGRMKHTKISNDRLEKGRNIHLDDSTEQVKRGVD